MVFKGTLRAVKNVTNGYSDVEAKVRTATSNDNSLPSAIQMHELAQMSYNQYLSSSPALCPVILLTMLQRGLH
jgi:ENTH domain